MHKNFCVFQRRCAFFEKSKVQIFVNTKTTLLVFIVVIPCIFDKFKTHLPTNTLFIKT
jgi:hypothetical protein